MIVSDRFWRLGSTAPRSTADDAHRGQHTPSSASCRRASTIRRRASSGRRASGAAPQTSRTAHNFRVVARVGDTAPSRRPARAQRLSRALKERYGDGRGCRTPPRFPSRAADGGVAARAPPALRRRDSAPRVACPNVSNLHLARASTRRREFAVRLAVGADTRTPHATAARRSAGARRLRRRPRRRHCLAGVRALATLQPANVPRIQMSRSTGPSSAFALAVALLTAVPLGLLTAARASDQAARRAPKARAASPAAGRSERVRQGLVVAQVALTMVLLVGAGLLARSFVQLLAVDPGLRTSKRCLDLIVAVRRDDPVTASARRRPARAARAPRGVPGVSTPASSAVSPRREVRQRTIHRDGAAGRVREHRRFADARPRGQAARRLRRLSHGQRRLLSRRWAFRWCAAGCSTSATGPPRRTSRVISESLAAAKWPGQDPLGRFIQFGNMDGDLRGFRIVGIVGDVRESRRRRAPGPFLRVTTGSG